MAASKEGKILWKVAFGRELGEGGQRPIGLRISGNSVIVLPQFVAWDLNTGNLMGKLRGGN